MGLSLVMQHHLGQTQTGWREMVPRLVLGLVAAATSLWWCAPKRSLGEPGDLAIHGHPAPYQTGVLPKDFVQRLNRLKKAGGLTWNGFARALRVDKKQMPRWRSGRRIQRPSA